VSFLQIIRNNPHYGIFLSKLLAQRLLRQNKKTLMLAEEIVELKKIADIPEELDE
jgi:CRP-like cAMP-binding protein